ncbi:MAG: TIGR02530 family flagellar biosynthesis protein [Bacillota bacterium]
MKVSGRELDRHTIIIPQPVPGKTEKSTAKSGAPVNSFSGILNAEFEKSREIKLSAHAERRLRERNVVLGQDDMRKIEGAVHRAAEKGSRESLVIYGDLALVASIRNRTIITAMEGKDIKEHVFTNIDSAVIIRKGDTPAEV